jgi:hypothetical protein
MIVTLQLLPRRPADRRDRAGTGWQAPFRYKSDPQTVRARTQVTALGAGVIVAFAFSALLVAATSQSADISVHVTSRLLIGVDLSPNLSVTGTLASRASH